MLAGQTFPIAAAPTNILPGLSVSGTEIIANGQPVRLHGVNMGDPFWARNPDWYPNYSTADYPTLAGPWQADIVRISIFPTQWKNMERAALLTGLAREINAALDNGLYVIISYHVIGWPDGWYQPAYPGNPADTYDSSMSMAISFWTQMAQTYGPDTRIIFDLWNEPVHDSSDWVGMDPNPYWPELKQSYESLIQTVRNNGAQNIVLATGNRWASWLVGIRDNPLTDSNVVYAYHKYSVEGLNTGSQWNMDTGGLIGVKPVIVSEWGYEDKDIPNPTWPGTQASYGIPFTQWMDNNHLSNLAWMYHHDWTPALLKANGSLTMYGAFVKSYIPMKTPPTVLSMNRASANPTKAASVKFTVTFSGAVTGVDKADFKLIKTGISSALISNVSGSGNTYKVTVGTGSGSGTLRLDLVDNDSIQNTSGIKLGGTGKGNGSFTSGENYTVDKTAPKASSMLRADPSPTDAPSVNFTITFSEIVTGVDIKDFKLTSTGTLTGVKITGLSGSGNTYTVTVNTGTRSGTLRLDLIDNDSIKDPAKNPLGGMGLINGNYRTGQIYKIR